MTKSRKYVHEYLQEIQLFFTFYKEIGKFAQFISRVIPFLHIPKSF